MEDLVPGKHVEMRCTLAGLVRDASTVRLVSKRLLFFTLANDDKYFECLAKERDGFLCESEIAMLHSHLAGKHDVAFVCFPETAPGGALSYHVVSASLRVDGQTTVELPGDRAALAPPMPAVPAPAADSSTAVAQDEGTVRFKYSGNRTRPANEARHQHFVSWLIDRYGLDFLRSGSGVLDVAGGAGGVAFELTFRRGIPCVVVDPRPMKLTTKQRRALRNRAASVASGVTDEREAELRASAGSSAASVPESYAAAAEEEGIDASLLPRQVCCEFDANFARGEHSELWRSCAMVVGMHPDQATEPVVDAALSDGKLFAVVPCCVFPRANPHRRLADGSPVNQYDEFVSYLLQKAAHCLQHQLPMFEGRNLVVHTQHTVGEGESQREAPAEVM